ncbi:MAG: DegV family protein [Thermodesulfobacteriota bacterium]
MELYAPQALRMGYERLCAWSEVLDQINVFPVADGDTGRNLLISLAPLRAPSSSDAQQLQEQLLFAARGNSGNIAVQFVAELLQAKSWDSLTAAAQAGAARAHTAVQAPRPGTMLTVLDSFTQALQIQNKGHGLSYAAEAVIKQIQDAVQETPELLPELKHADVVDAGALGMFLFLEGYLKGFCCQEHAFSLPRTVFGSRLKLAELPQAAAQEQAFCVDLVLRLNQETRDFIGQLVQEDHSASVYTFQDYAKIHLHTKDAEALRQKAQDLGSIVKWNQDNLQQQLQDFQALQASGPVHIVTDAAGSLSRELAWKLGITLLDSYISLGRSCIPETCLAPAQLYQAMREGKQASTSQASVFEREQHFTRLLEQYPSLLYLCVGSVYTGNYQVAVQWKAQHDPQDKFAVLDTGAASGRLAVAAIATARFASQAQDQQQVLEFAQQAVAASREYIFLNELKYLAAGGRMSKTGAFFGDMLHMKPVITPTAQGAEKAGLVRNSQAQISFALHRLQKSLDNDSRALILLQYSDNSQWVQDKPGQEIKRLFPKAEIIVQPLSLTSGVHIGPGAWAVAWHEQ